MKGRVILLTLVALFVGVTVCLADSPHMGTWKLNEAKSKFGPGAPKNTTVVYEAAGDSVKWGGSTPRVSFGSSMSSTPRWRSGLLRSSSAPSETYTEPAECA